MEKLKKGTYDMLIDKNEAIKYINVMRKSKKLTPIDDLKEIISEQEIESAEIQKYWENPDFVWLKRLNYLEEDIDSIEKIIPLLAFLTKTLDTHKAQKLINECGYKKLMTYLALLSPQKRSPILEGMSLGRRGLSKVASTQNMGDGVDQYGYVEEHKQSMSIMEKSPKFNICQIRSYQNIDIYHLEFYELSSDYKYFVYEFSIPAQMFYNIFSHIMSNCHGTKNSNELNENIEKRVTLKKEGQQWNDIQRYRIRCEEL